ncbi:MAG TPA: hypothetical protein VGQ00_02025 [Candidatus Norongarragalinales archaeon]|jgi:hypothetical protein|nr:hypothetical protein [Candidatus Norongarragalinales archaeon]
MKGQFAIELLLMLIAVFLMLQWGIGYATLAKNNYPGTVAQLKIAAASIASAADQACLKKIAVTFPEPCIYSGSQPVSYNVVFTNGGIRVSGIDLNASAPVGCITDTSLLPAFYCVGGQISNNGPLVCAQPDGNGGAKMFYGACV